MPAMPRGRKMRTLILHLDQAGGGMDNHPLQKGVGHDRGRARLESQSGAVRKTRAQARHGSGMSGRECKPDRA